MAIKTEFEFNLTTTFNYESSGEQAVAHKLILRAPTNKERTQRIRLKQYVTQAGTWFEKEYMSKTTEAEITAAVAAVTAEKTEEQTNSEYVQLANMFYMCPTIDMTKVIEEFLMLLKEVCTVEGEKKLTSPLFDKMSPDDTDRLLGAYCVNFLRGSS